MASSPRLSCAPRRSALVGTSSARMVSSVATIAAMHTGLPPKVEMVLPRQLPAISSVAIVAPTGIPPAIPFAITMMSGATSQCSIPNHLPPVRPKPACTSSAMKRPPYDRMISAIRWK